MDRRPRVGIVDYLNSQPLAWSFLSGEYGDLYQASYHPPAEVARRLAAGEIDIGLIPSIELQRIPDLSVIPGVCVAATHEVRSVLLISPGPIEEIRRVALDENSRTSATLVKVLLAERYGLEPEYVARRADVGAMLEDCDAALIIGDPALHIDHSKGHVLDLAAEWRTLTGLPFVFAVWAVRPGVEGWESDDFAASLAHGKRNIDRMVERAIWNLGLEESVLHEYLTRFLSFELGAEERQALEEYFRRAHRHGWVGAPQAVRYL